MICTEKKSSIRFTSDGEWAVELPHMQSALFPTLSQAKLFVHAVTLLDARFADRDELHSVVAAMELNDMIDSLLYRRLKTAASTPRLEEMRLVR